MCTSCKASGESDMLTVLVHWFIITLDLAQTPCLIPLLALALPFTLFNQVKL